MTSWPVETLCDYQSAGGPVVTHVRGTLIASSQQTLREAGHYAHYERLLPEAVREQLLFTIALSWVPVEVALAHYGACEALDLRDHELEAMGQLVAERLAGTFLGTVLRASREAGLDAPWVALRAQPRIWDRLYMGGIVRIYRTGPKDATAEFYGLPLSQLRYFRVAYCSYYRALAGMFVRNAHVKPTRPREALPHAFALTGSWV